MEGTKIPVKIKMVTEIRELGQKAEMVVEEEGIFLMRGSMSVLQFVEHQDDSADIHAFITIQPEKVSVKRTGAVDMHQIFRKKERTENVYKHEFGSILMETHTDQITYQNLEQGKKGKLFISYTTKLNGEGSRRHRLTITFKEA